MKKKVKTEFIDEFMMTRIEYLNHLKISYESIIENILRKRSKYEYNKELLDYYMQKYQEANISFITLANEIVREIDKQYLEPKYYYDFNFDDFLLTIYESEEYDEKSKMGAIPRCNFKNNVE